MGRFKIGNILFFVASLLYAAALASSARIELSFLNQQGGEVSTAIVGDSYRVVVKLMGQFRKAGKVYVPGLPADYIVAQQQRQEVSWIQGVYSSVVYEEFNVVTSRVGVMRLGPVRATTDDGVEVASRELMITVVDQLAGSGPAQNQSSSNSSTASADRYFVRWELLRPQAYCGECVPCTLCFYTTDQQAHIEALSPFTVERGILKVEQNALWDSVEHHGVRYRRCSWKGYFVAGEAGSYWLPPIDVQFVMSARSNRSPWGMISAFMLGGAQRDIRRAPGVAISVQDLPPPSEPVVGVGALTSIVWKLEKTECAAGEAVTATCSIRGACAPESLRTELLLKEQDGLRSYASTVKQSGIYPEMVCEQEFVLQPLKPGAYEIGQQEYISFDPDKKIYYRISVEPQQLTVHPSSSAVPPMVPAVPDGTANTLPDRSSTREIPAESVLDQAEQAVDYQLSWWIFLILCLLPPCVIIGTPFVLRWWQWIRNYLFIEKTRRSLRAAGTAGDGAAVARAFRACMIYAIGDKELLFLREAGAAWLLQQGYSQDTGAAWMQLMDDLDRIEFSTPVRGAAYDAQVGEQARELARRAEDMVLLMRHSILGVQR